MSKRWNRLLVASLVSTISIAAFAGPAGASGESIGACVAERFEEALEHHGHSDHMTSEDIRHVAHDETVQDELEGCLEAPSPILPELNEIIWGGAAFLILFVIMVKKGFPAVKGAMDARAEKIRADLDAAEQAKTDAQAVQSDYEAQLADAKTESARIIEEARVTADQLRTDLSTQAEGSIAEMREKAAADVEAQKAQAIADLRAEVSGIALGAAERVVQSSLDADAQARLIDAYIDEVTGSND
ncbi:MAG TPA: F0F1 ATP synthase subunit B [Acidimicrobiales bacterium]|nr:F0F1 ATP synthase subunit B [Acidimicrobiales bacterium]|tara:strand:- start:4972 stop:5703 length:732 start_codon:yes stop_codon:yes gene_type:complete